MLFQTVDLLCVCFFYFISWTRCIFFIHAFISFIRSRSLYQCIFYSFNVPFTLYTLHSLTNSCSYLNRKSMCNFIIADIFLRAFGNFIVKNDSVENNVKQSLRIKKNDEMKFIQTREKFQRSCYFITNFILRAVFMGVQWTWSGNEKKEPQDLMKYAILLPNWIDVWGKSDITSGLCFLTFSLCFFSPVFSFLNEQKKASFPLFLLLSMEVKAMVGYMIKLSLMIPGMTQWTHIIFMFTVECWCFSATLLLCECQTVPKII